MALDWLRWDLAEASWQAASGACFLMPTSNGEAPQLTAAKQGSVMMSETDEVFGKVCRRKDGDILYASNEWVSMAYVVADDPRKIGHMGWHGPDEICVEYITPEQGKLWDVQS